MYLIRNLCPRTDLDMGNHAFTIELSKEWPEYVKKSELTQEKINYLIAQRGNAWLDACGYDRMWQMEEDSPKKRLHEARSSIRVSWGEYGAEHITVPGNACGLDLDSHAFGCFLRGGKMLLPHNIDS